MKKVKISVVISIGLLWVFSSGKLAEFKEHVIFQPAGSWGKTGFGDFNADGHLDITAGPSKGAVYWFQNPGSLSGEWKRHEIDPKNGGCVGGEPADVDGDGLVDFISHGIWYRNNPDAPGEKFEKHAFHKGGLPGMAGGCHDFVAADINKDGKPDAMNHGVSWWENPGGEEVNGIWKEHVVVSKVRYWGNVAHRGWGDIDGDGDVDVVGIGDWYRNEDGKGTQWKKINYANWATAIDNRTWVADLDGDGDNDIAQGEGDVKNGKAAWSKNLDGKGEKWESFMLDITGDLHSLGALDFDNDGDNDIFIAQNGSKDRDWAIFENDGQGNFTKQVIYNGFGSHEAIFADFDKDGDIDIFSKCWCKGGAGVILENKLDPVAVQDKAFKNKELKKRTAFTARISDSRTNPKLEFTAIANGKYSIELFDMNGERLVFESGEGQRASGAIPLKPLQGGIYIARVNLQKGSIARRIILF